VNQLNHQINAGGAEIVLMADPKIAAIPVAGSTEPLCDLRTVSGLLVDDQLADADGAYAHLRRSVVDRLVHAQGLLPDGLRLLLVEGFRPPRLQAKYFDDYRAGLRAEHPDWPADRLHLMASRFVSPPEIAPHSAGAAIDLTLSTEDGAALDMGTPINATPEESNGGCYTDSLVISGEAMSNRAILGSALREAGLVNYPTEWWHWSYGDRYWALSTGAQAALFPPADWPI
jgi:zinc D-Ala-D-Ala dipeptidase